MEASPDETPVLEENADESVKEQEELRLYIEEARTKIEGKNSLRQENVNCTRPPEEFFSMLDSNLKKNTAFVKKLKQFTVAQLDSLMKDMSSLNLTKYITEICAALVEAKLKMTDVPAVVTLSSKLHRIYSEFSASFFENWQKTLLIKPGERIANPSKMRVDLRLFAELVSAGIFSNKIGLPVLGQTLTNLISQDKDDHSNLSIILSFCRHCGEEYAGLVPKTIVVYSQKYNHTLPISTLLTPDKQQNLRNLLRDYYCGVTKHLKNEHKELQSAERTNRKIMESKGELSQERRERLELLQTNFEKLQISTQTLAELLNETIPDLPKDAEAGLGGVICDIDDFADVQLDPWGDDETRNFYVDLPELRLYLPNFAPKIEAEEPSVDELPLTDEALDIVIGEMEAAEAEETVSVVELPPPAEPVEVDAIVDAVVAPSYATTKIQFDAFLMNLKNCVNKELIDSAAIEFLLSFNTKNNRKRLAKSLFGIQRTRLDLMPFFGRLVATINLVSSDVANDLCQLLKHDFRYHVKKKDQINIESKIKAVRFIGELVKFGLYTKAEALFCLKDLLHDFQHHHIEMTCAFLEVCGKYLYNCRESRLRTNFFLEQMLRLKTATALDSRHSAQIENVYYLVKPPETGGIVAKIRPPMHMYVRHLVFDELNKSNIDRVIRLMRRLNWDDPDTNGYAVKCLTKAYLLRYHIIRCLADVVSGLSSYQDKAIVRVIDGVFEDIRAGLEIHSPKLAQRRIAMAKYLGELYNYRLVDAANVLNTLYSIISLGVSCDHSIVSEVDPPGSLFRLKLACVLLDTCGQYFTSAVSRKRLDYYLIFFQQYYWFKKSDPIFGGEDGSNESDGHSTTSDLFPILVDHMYKECLSNVRPKLKLYSNLEQAREAVEKLRQQLYPTLTLSTEDGADGGPNEEALDKSGLDSITEVDSEHEDTNNEMTEDNTSEAAVGDSDDDRDVRAMPKDELAEEAFEAEELMEGTRSPTEQADIGPIERETTQEDLDFEQAFEKMAIDSFQERLRDPAKPNAKDIPVPLVNRTSGKKTYDQLNQTSEQKTVEESAVPFVLMLRGPKGGKQQFKTFSAPSDSALAINLRLQEQKIREDNEQVKRLTLNITERIEEEDYQESLIQSQRSPAQARYPRQPKPQKYKHQKGVPDADKIFN